MRDARNGSNIMTQLDMINDGHELMLSREGSDKVDLFLFPVGSPHFANEEGLFAYGTKPCPDVIDFL